MEGLDFAKERNKDDGWVGHSLDIAHVRSVDVEDFQELAYFQDEPGLGLIMSFAIEGAFDIFFDLNFDFLVYKMLISFVE